MLSLIEQWRKEVLGPTCRICSGSCCSYNFQLTTSQVKLIFGEEVLTLVPGDITERNKHLFNYRGEPLVGNRIGDTYITQFDGEDFCPQFKEGRCAIHEHPNRPDTCKQYPIYVDLEKRTIEFHDYCLATGLPKIAGLCVKALEKSYQVSYIFNSENITRNRIEEYIRVKYLRDDCLK